MYTNVYCRIVRWQIYIILFALLVPAISYSQAQIDSMRLSDGVWCHYITQNQPPQLLFNKLLNKFQGVRFNNVPYNNTVALLVGVSEYDYLPNLRYVESELKQLKNFLLTQGGVDTVFVMQNTIASEELVERYMLDYFPKTLSRNDRIIFYYSGHADDIGDTGFMQFQKATPNIFSRDVLSIKNTMTWSKANPAKHMLFLFDCCSSGLAFDAKGEITDSEERRLASLSGEGSRIVITAGNTVQKTYDGWFTPAFLKGLTSNRSDLFITVHEIYSVIQKEIANRASKEKIKKVKITPKLWELENYDGTFIFVNPNRIISPIDERIKALITPDKDTPNSKGEPANLPYIAYSTGKLLVITDQIRSNTDIAAWMVSQMQSQMEQTLDQQDAFVCVTPEKLDDFLSDSSTIATDERTRNEQVIRNAERLQADFCYLAVQIDSFSIDSDTVITRQPDYAVNTRLPDIETTNITWTAQLTLTVDINSKNEKVSRIIHGTGTSSSKYKAILISIDQLIKSLESLLLGFHPLSNAHIIRKDGRSLWLDVGFRRGANQGDFFHIINPKNSEPVALVRIDHSKREEARAKPLEGYRLVHKDYIARQVLQPKLLRGVMSIKYMIIPVSHSANEGLSPNALRDASYYCLSLELLKLGNPIMPYIGLGAGILGHAFYTSNDTLENVRGLIFELGLGMRLDIIPGFAQIDASAGGGISKIKQKLTDKSKFMIRNSGIDLDSDDAYSDWIYTYRTNLNVQFFLDKRGTLAVFAGFGLTISSWARSWSVDLPSRETPNELKGLIGDTHTPRVEVDSRLVPFQKIRFEGITSTIGITIK